jgi:hypothetical protein
MATTTAMCASGKAEMAQGMHCFAAPIVLGAATTMNATVNVTAIPTPFTVGVVTGMLVTGTSIAANTFVAAVPATTTLLTLSQAASGSTSNTITCSGDVFKAALIKVGPAGTYGVGSTNYTNITGNSDEVSGTGYTVGGFAWTAAQNITPAVTSPSAFWSWSANPSWTSATISATAMMIYNTSLRGGASAAGTNRAISCHDFGGTQTVTAGTLTVLLPTKAVGTAILQLTYATD